MSGQSAKLLCKKQHDGKTFRLAWLSRSWIKGTCSLIRKGMVCKTCIPAVLKRTRHLRIKLVNLQGSACSISIGIKGCNPHLNQWHRYNHILANWEQSTVSFILKIPWHVLLFTLRDMTWFAFWSQFAQITNMLQPHSNRNSICLSWVWLSRSWIKGTCSLIRKGMVCKTCIPAVHSTSLHNDRKSIYKAQLVRSVLESRDANLIWTNGIDTITSLPTGSSRLCHSS